jgi:hypothetical protein
MQVASFAHLAFDVHDELRREPDEVRNEAIAISFFFEYLQRRAAVDAAVRLYVVMALDPGLEPQIQVVEILDRTRRELVEHVLPQGAPEALDLAFARTVVGPSVYELLTAY